MKFIFLLISLSYSISISNRLDDETALADNKNKLSLLPPLNNNINGMKTNKNETFVLVPENVKLNLSPKLQNLPSKNSNVINTNEHIKKANNPVKSNPIINEAENTKLNDIENRNADISVNQNTKINEKSSYYSFGTDKQTEIRYQNLFSKILSLSLLNMFTDISDEKSFINLLIVLKNQKVIANKNLFKIIFTVNNPKYVTGSVFFGIEFAIPVGFEDANINEVDFISFGKSVIFNNILNLLSINDKYEELPNLAFLNETVNNEGMDFDTQTKLSISEFVNNVINYSNEKK